jgi:diadenosine tetraphosphatase ApaH/serine/threonine PP2A family protein phosphatase
VNALYGFRAECERRCADGAAVWDAVNKVFDMMPVAAVVDDSVLCLHGGLGSSLRSLAQAHAPPSRRAPSPPRPLPPQPCAAGCPPRFRAEIRRDSPRRRTPQIESLPRPARVDLNGRGDEGRLLNDILWSDPTENDEADGVHPNKRGQNTVTFGSDRVRDFLGRNRLKLLVRAHQCVQDGFEYFGGGRLLTVFSAPDYGGKFTNDGAMLIINRQLHVLPKVIRSRGAAVAQHTWVSVPDRPPTPPRPRREAVAAAPAATSAPPSSRPRSPSSPIFFEPSADGDAGPSGSACS